MRVIVQLSPVALLQDGAAALAELPRALNDVLGRHRTRLRPMHPGTTDPNLATWFHAEVGDASEAQVMVSELRGLPAVQAAYVKPPEGPPG